MSEQKKQWISLDEETRNGYCISAEMKKLWNVQFDLLMQLDQVCRKIIAFSGIGIVIDDFPFARDNPKAAVPLIQKPVSGRSTLGCRKAAARQNHGEG